MKIDSEILKAIGMINQIGISMMVPIIGCLFLGKFLDDKLSTKPWLLIIFIIIGIMVAFRNLYAITKSFSKSGKKRP